MLERSECGSDGDGQLWRYLFGLSHLLRRQGQS
jgi:hypothetical protein